MADEASRSEDVDATKSKGWGKLRGKIFDKEAMRSKFKRNHSHEEEVDQFLRPVGGTSPNLSSPAGPKLDLSAIKKPAGSSVDDTGFLDSVSATVGEEGGIPSYAPTREDMTSGKWIPHKPTRRPGLQVWFVDGPADIIGEGGDESEEVPFAIGERRTHTRSVIQSRPPERQSQAATAEPVMPRLTRAPTGFASFPATQDAQNDQGSHAGEPPSVIPSPTHRRKPSLVPYPAPGVHPVSLPTENLVEAHQDQSTAFRTRAATGFHETPGPHQQAADASSELHLESPESRPSSQAQTTSYEQQMQQILTNTYTRDKSPANRSRATSNSLPNNPPPRNPARMHSPPANRSPARNEPTRVPPSAELRSPVDSGSMRKMRAEEGLAHRSSVQGAHGIPGVDDSVAAALSKLSPGLEAPAPYSTQTRSSFDSARSGNSEQSRYSHSPEPSSFPPYSRFSMALAESASFLSPPTSSHGPLPRSSPHHRQGGGSQDSLPPFPDRASANDVSVTPASRPEIPPTFERPQPLNLRQQVTKEATRRPTSMVRDPNAEEAYTLFASAVSGSGSIFGLATEKTEVQLTVYDWTRCALWWFLRGREGIETHNRASSSKRGGTSPGRSKLSAADALRQDHLNLAKSYWMLTEKIPHLLNNASRDSKICPPSQSLGSVDEACGTLDENFKLLCLLMRRSDVMPPAQEKFLQGLNSDTWLPQPFERLPPDWQWVLSGKVFAPPRQTLDAEPMAAIPLQDTRSKFCYGRIFVSGTVGLGEEKPTLEPFECVLSFVRAKSSAEAEIVVSSQSKDVNVHIRAAGEQGVHWEHTRFDEEERSLRIKLPQKLRLKLFCSQKDYSYLWSFFDNSQRISQSLVPKKNERLVQSARLRSFQYRDTAHPDEFPSDAVGVCRAALFEQLIKSDRNPRTVHAGHRFAVVNLEKTVRNVHVSFGKSAPFEYSVSPSQPTLQFQLNEAGRRRSAHLVFEDNQQRDMLRDLLSGTVFGNNESVLCQLPLTSLALSRATASNLVPAGVRWGGIQVIDEDDPADPEHLSSSADASDNLRVMLYSQTGSIVDRMNDAVVDFKIRLEPARHEHLQIYRGAGRHDLTIAIGPDPAESSELRQMFDVASSGPHVSTYSFSNLKDMHQFQRAVTGFAVVYDGVASSFSIPRRKTGSMIAKHLESKEARVQLIEREKVVQLIAFFVDYILADSMNFELRPTDKYEAMDSKTSGPSVKLVDAKFVLPGSGKDDPVKDGAVRDASARYTAFDTENYNEERKLRGPVATTHRTLLTCV